MFGPMDPEKGSAARGPSSRQAVRSITTRRYHVLPRPLHKCTENKNGKQAPRQCFGSWNSNMFKQLYGNNLKGFNSSQLDVEESPGLLFDSVLFDNHQSSILDAWPLWRATYY